MDNFCRLRVPGVQALGRAWPCAPFPLLPLRQWDPFCQPRTPAHTGETRGRACGRCEWDRPQTRRASARPVQAKAARSQWGPRGQGTPRSGFGQRVLLPGRTPAARSAPIPDWKSGSPALEPPRVPCRMTGTAPTVPQVPESRRRRFQGDGNDACSAKRSPSVPATFTQVSAHAGGWHGAVNHAQTCQPGGVAPSRQSRVDVPDQPVWSRGLARGS